jgi:hypothetical protein
MHQQKLVPPFANSDSEIAEVEGFAVRQGLDQIARICGELRSARQEVLDLRGLNESYAKSLGLPRVVRTSLGFREPIQPSGEMT